MSGAHWEKIERLFNHAVELDTTERARFLTQLQQDDASVYPEVAALLNADELRLSFEKRRGIVWKIRPR